MSRSSNPAPIVLFTYNRLDNTRQTVEHLKKNTLAIHSDLIIFSDASKTDKDRSSIQEVRDYLNCIKGFKNCIVIKREENYGLAKNIIEGVTEIINKYGKVIVLEDDLLTSKNFLCYMNASLVYYQNTSNIFAISGYTGDLPSLHKLYNDNYLSYRPSSWGWATWKDQWDNIDWDIIDYTIFINSKKEVKKFNRGGIDMARMLRHYIEGKNNSWAIRWSYEMYKRGQYCVAPKVSKIQNIGFGKNATHCSGINIYQTILDETSKCNFSFTDEIAPNTQIAKEFRYQYSYTNKLFKKTVGFLLDLKKQIGR